MWAGGRFAFHRPLRVGDDIVRTSTIENVVAKEGRTGPLVFVTHEGWLTMDAVATLR
jgi:3-methylfumaryl-CoA hydratase